MSKSIRRVVTGHDAHGKSVVISDGAPAQNHAMQGPSVGADFHEMWSVTDPIPQLTPVEEVDPTERAFALMPAAGHRLRLLDVQPLNAGGNRTVMHRTRTLDYVVVIEGELTLILDDSATTLYPGDVVVQRGTDHAWENRGATIARAVFFHIDARFSETLLALLPEPLGLLGYE